MKRGDFVDLRKDGLIKAIQGLTTVQQVLAATQEAY
jgi:type II secretory ATPase GspE/PulE/Tfp pilus assembly ATPase PilB-like protein